MVTRLNFAYHKSSFVLVKNEFKKIIFQKLTKEGSNLFLRGQDFISTSLQVTGTYEPHITTLIHHFSTIGYADFFVDIGANIGLSSCQNGNSFKEVHMFEPNPYCCKVLEVNSDIALKNTEYHIHNFGLGEEDVRTVLTVPKGNWGGAFINDKSNTYDDNILAHKDGFHRFSNENYFSVEIEMRKTTTVLKKIFQELDAKNLTCGVVKIDVEGYESAVLQGLAEALPSRFKILIVFESWDSSFDMDSIVELFKGRAVAYKFNHRLAVGKQYPKLLKLILLMLNPKPTYELIENKTPDWSGNLVLQID